MAIKRKLDSTVLEEKLKNEQLSGSSEDEEDEESEGEEEEPEDLDENVDGDEDSDSDEEDEDEAEDEDEDEDEDGEEEEESEAEENNQVEDEEEEDFSTKESIRNLLAPFAKDQLIEIFKESALKNPTLLSRVVNEADADPVHRNLFVHGLGWDVTSETLTSVFSPFGKLESCKVVTNQATGRCKGYGFVLFRSRAAAQRALKEPLKKIGSRIANCQLAYLGPPATGQTYSEITGRKLYVGNVGSEVNPDRLLAFFSKFGEIELGPLGIDPASGKLRGYALFIYKTVEGLNRALEEPTKYFEGCELLCKKALEGHSKSNSSQIATESVPSGMQGNDVNVGYASAAALMGQNPATVIGPSVGVGLLNPVGGLSGGGAGVYQQSYGVGGGIAPQSYGVVGQVGSANRGSGGGINAISPSVIGSYGSLAALHGLGAYQNSASSVAARPQPSIGSLGASGLASFYRQ